MVIRCENLRKMTQKTITVFWSFLVCTFELIFLKSMETQLHISHSRLPGWSFPHESEPRRLPAGCHPLLRPTVALGRPVSQAEGDVEPGPTGSR